MDRTGNPFKENRIALALAITAFALCLTMLFLPAFSFKADVYTLKSGNTFVGDEKYTAALEKVNAVAEEYRTKGFDITVNEDVIERTNSKGNKTSMVTFTLTQTFTKSGVSVLLAGLPSSYVLLAAYFCLVLAAACAVTGALGSMHDLYRCLDARASILRSAACICALIGLLLIPVFFMTNTYALSRRVSLYASGALEEGKEAFYALLNSFLFGGNAGEDIASMLSGLTYHCTSALWCIMPCAFGMLIACVQLRFGSIKKVLLRGLLYTFVVVMCILILYPYYVMLVTGFRSSAETNDMYFLNIFPAKWIFSNMEDIINRGVLTYLKNSLLIAGGATGIALLCGIPAAYAMARMRFKGRKVFLGFVIMSQMFSPVVLLIGITQLMSDLHLSDSILGLMLINAAFNQAFAIWLLRGTFVSISPEMEQAAKIDGCSSLGAMLRILIPMSAPGIVTTLIFVFINAWNEYTISTVLISTAANRPITVGITQFSSFNMIEWQYLFAASLLATVPVVILFSCIEKHLTSGLTSGGVKG